MDLNNVERITVDEVKLSNTTGSVLTLPQLNSSWVYLVTLTPVEKAQVSQQKSIKDGTYCSSSFNRCAKW